MFSKQTYNHIQPTNNTFKFLMVVYTCSIPRVNMKYSQALSYVCQVGSMLRNLSPALAGPRTPKFPIWKIIQTGNNIIQKINLSRMLLSMIRNEIVECSLLKDKPQIHNFGNMDQSWFQTTWTSKSPGSISVSLGLE